MNNERPENTKNTNTGMRSKELDNVRRGVSCALTTIIDGKTYFVFTTLPDEDHADQIKIERSTNWFLRLRRGWVEKETMLVPEMLSFPGGAVNNKDVSEYDEMSREILEELDLVVNPKKLVFMNSFIITEQNVVGSNTARDRRGSHEYMVGTFTYQLDDEEVSMLKKRMANLGRRVEVMTPEECLENSERFRPTTIEVVRWYQLNQKINRGEVDTDIY
ncbi:MAG TPA: hypothetical protein VLH19_04800 [Patescibacteria group bacterium]|nr:hypothetical protein [Patescibacteria group bacterium]